MTIVRTGFFEADLDDEQKQDFYQYMEKEVLPLIQKFPNNLGVVLSKPQFIEAESHQHLILMMQHGYNSEELMNEALNSPERIASMNATKKIVEKYNIRVHHVNFLRD